MTQPRITPCSHRPPCPGCPHFGRSGIAPEAVEAFETLAREASLASPPLIDAPPGGHRHRARLAVRGRSRSPKVGLFQEGTHRIVDIPRCPVHHPAINEAVALLKAAIRRTETPPYVERSHRGLLRYVQLAVERSTARVQVVLVANAREPDAIGPLAEEVERSFGGLLQGLFFNGQDEQTNAILGPHWAHLAGEPMLRETFDGCEAFFPPGAFGQSHLPLFELLARRARALVPEGARVAELYTGVGAIGLGLLGRVASLHFNERSGDALAGLARGIAARPAEERARARVFPGAAGELPEVLDGCDTVVVDPPRRGLDASLLDALCERPPPRLVYVSCGRESIAVEAHRLLESGRVRLAGLELYDLFPFTEHVEALAWFDRCE